MKRVAVFKMHDKRMQSEEDLSVSVQDGDRKDEVNYVKLESSCSGNLQIQTPSMGNLPPGYHRQGYCSCCQVHYINLEKHLASEQHRHVSNLHRNRFNTSTLMERFLQDVHLYHPQNYHDSRPTYDDIPEVNVLQSFHGVRAGNHSQTNQPTASSTMLTAWDKHSTSDFHRLQLSSNKMTCSQLLKTNPEERKDYIDEVHQQGICTCKSSLTTCQKALCKTTNTIPRTFACSTLPLKSTNQLTVSNKCFETPYAMLSSGANISRGNEYKKHTECPSSDMTGGSTKSLNNRQFSIQGSYCHLTSGTAFRNERIFNTQESKGCILRDHVLFGDSNKMRNDGECKSFSHFENKVTTLTRDDENSIDTIIEAVIKKFCHDPSSNMIAEKQITDEESVLSLNVPSITGCTADSSLSFDWNVPLELKEDYSKGVTPNLDLHTGSSVNVDEEYKSKLKFVLRESLTAESEPIKPQHEETVLPALPHIPPSFVGKTWSQVMYEDDLKIEALVKEFRKGKFHCYFEDECPANAGSKKRHKSKQIEKKIDVNTEDLDDSQKMNVLPLFEHDFCEDHNPDTYSIKSERVLKTKFPKPCRRVWRQVSRCQVVKVSHGTQTSLVNYPVVRRKILKSESQKGIFDDFVDERTPDMKTRMCAVKLPESYTRILTPLQPKTMVYVLSHPDVKPSTCRRSRNRCSTDSRDSIYYKYKQSPLKYYDPLTNRILKTPPRNSLQGLNSKVQCVRKLFRSLSSEGNVDKVDIEQKESSASKKSLSSCSAASIHFESVKGKYLNSSIKGSRSSGSSEYTGSGYVKSRYSEKPYAHISISPCKAASTKVTEDIQHGILIAKSKSKPLRPHKIITKDPSKPSTMHSKPVMKARVAVPSKHCPHKMGKNLGKQTETKSRCKNQSRRKSSPVLAKSNKPFLKAQQSNKKKAANQRNERTGDDYKKRLVKSRFISSKPTKRKQSMTKSSVQSKLPAKYITRSQGKAPEFSVPNTRHYLRSRCTILNKASTTRTFTNTRTRTKAR